MKRASLALIIKWIHLESTFETFFEIKKKHFKSNFSKIGSKIKTYLLKCKKPGACTLNLFTVVINSTELTLTVRDT